MKSSTITITKEEYEDMTEYMERLRETIDVLSNKDTVRKLNAALARMEKGKYLTKKDMVF